MEIAIQTNKLTKYYRGGAVLGVANLNLTVKQGEIFGFIGPNGAGKSTTIRLLLDLIRPTSGSATVLGHDVNKDPVAVHHHLGYLPGEIFLPDHLTGGHCLDYYRRFRDHVDPAYLKSLLKRLDLSLSPRVGTYSKGNRQKLAIIIALMHQPDLLLLDEPTSGLDPLNQQTFYELIRETKERGATTFFSTHVLSEANSLCDRVGIIKKGQLLAVLDIDELRAKNIRHVEITVEKPIPLHALHGPGVHKITKTGVGYHLVTAGPLGPLVARLDGHPILDLKVSEPSLEESFMQYYQK